MTTELFTREGQAITRPTGLTEKGQRGYVEPKPCGRCGGAGGSEKWRHTGWTCYHCGGKCFDGTRFIRAFTQAELAKLNAAKTKRDATLAAKRAAKAQAEQERRQVERDQVIADHADILKLMRPHLDASGFLTELTDQVTIAARPLSQAQVDAAQAAVAKLAAEQARLAAATWVGQVGQRLELELTLVRSVLLYSGQFGDTYLTIGRTPTGSTVTYKGRWNGLDFPTHIVGTGRDRDIELVPGGRVLVKATVKEHGRNRRTDEPETLVCRPALVRRLGEAAQG